ncbi:uncharacterized protein VP01_606g5 [Puccinia sorghi]|uniref:DDE Tnp4 domain-containing protein n=1 Tax=Puccinia sorghi TaxID=27349 RepID=A0A0L6UH64_9BASI|nr:uncharacterized protein VP01_606g5 [Puccinia sorghi]
MKWGFTLPLDEKPSIDSQGYYSRKGSYRFSKSILFDSEKQIIYYLTGGPAFSHTRRLWDKCNLNLQNTFNFNWEKFNQDLASLQICDEECIGILKGSFKSLRVLQMELSSVEKMERITKCVDACVVLHN